MDEKLAILRAKKLGLLIRQARENIAQSIENCASWLNISPEDFGAVENGEAVLSLPQMESLAFFLRTSFNGLIYGPAELSQSEPAFDRELNLHLLVLRDHIISTLLKEHRSEKGLTLEQLAAETNISLDYLQSYEDGSVAVPFIDLEELSEKLALPLDGFFSATGPFSHDPCQSAAESANPVLDLPPDLLEFIAKPVNRPYLELALRLSQLEADKLRAIASSLLEITY